MLLLLLLAATHSVPVSFNVLMPLNVWKLVSIAPEDFTFSICVQSAWKWFICFSFSFRFEIAYHVHFNRKNERVLGEIGKWLKPKWFSTMRLYKWLLLSASLDWCKWQQLIGNISRWLCWSLLTTRKYFERTEKIETKWMTTTNNMHQIGRERELRW